MSAARFLGDGRYRLSLGEAERALLRSLPGQLLALLGTDDPSLTRLFPPAYASAEDAELEAEYRRLMGSELLDRRRAALETIAATVDADELDEEQMGAWLTGVNQLRLVLGTRLEVSEDSRVGEPAEQLQASGLELYRYLNALHNALVEAAEDAL